MLTDLIDQPINTDKYDIYNIDNLPKCFLGIRVKNRFDQTRIKIKSKYNPKFIAHFKTVSQLEPIFLYGIEIKVKPQYANMLRDINYNSLFKDNQDVDVCVDWYKKKIDDYDLSCNTCYKYLSDGVYPLDVSCLEDISLKDLSSEMRSGFKEMVTKNNTPWYLSLMNFNLFILTATTGYKVT